jgi:hypothetical protein
MEAEMKIAVSHERALDAAPERISALIADFDRVWPQDIAPAPRQQGPGVYDTGLMRWEEFDRPGAIRAFRVTRPAGLNGEHWFELVVSGGMPVLRHTVDASASGAFATIWRARIARLHDQILEALLDKVQQALAQEEPSGR